MTGIGPFSLSGVTQDNNETVIKSKWQAGTRFPEISKESIKVWEF